MSFKEKFYGKTTVIGKAGIFDAISSFKYPIDKTAPSPQTTKYMRSSTMEYHHSRPEERPSLISKRAGISALTNPAHSISQIKLKYSIGNIKNASSPHKLLSERKLGMNTDSQNDFSRKARQLQDIAFRNINNELLESNRSKIESIIMKSAKRSICKEAKDYTPH
jgi:hypothetical protein